MLRLKLAVDVRLGCGLGLGIATRHGALFVALPFCILAIARRRDLE